MAVTDAAVLAGLGSMRFIAGKRHGTIDLRQALSGPPVLTRTIDGASTLELTVKDPKRTLIRAAGINDRTWVTIGKGKQRLGFELVAIEKSGSEIKLTYEDSIVAALRRRTSRLPIPANSMTRHAVVAKLAREAEVPFVVDESDSEKVHNALVRSPKGEKSDSWEFLGTEVAEPRNWRRFSNGRRLVVGPDQWLLDRDPAVTVIRENTGPFGWVNFDLDVGRRVSDADLEVDVETWDLPPGAACRVVGLGPADGKWIVAEIVHTIGTSRATVTLVRKTHELDEPKRESSGNGGQGDPGSPDYIPGNGDGTDSGGTTATAARGRMVAFALAQRGDQYEWGGNGPSEWDCSGLVQGATAAAGHQLTKPSASQASAVAAAGKGMSIETAIRTRGALLFRMGSPYNHVAISLGNGQTIEAMGEAYGVCIGSAHGRGWTSAGWWV